MVCHLFNLRKCNGSTIQSFIATDILRHIGACGTRHVRLVCKDMNEAFAQKRLTQIKRIQLWWRRFRLVLDCPPEHVTRSTLIRYYIAKYPSKWLAQFPIKAMNKIPFLVMTPHEKVKFSKIPEHSICGHFRAFCVRHMPTSEHFYYYGW